MKKYGILFFVFLIISITACKKSTDTVTPKPIETTLFFHGVINGKTLDVLQADATLGNGESSTIPGFSHVYRTYSANYPNPYGDPKGVDTGYRIYIEPGGIYNRAVLIGHPADDERIAPFLPFAEDETFYDLFSLGRKRYLNGKPFDLTIINQDSTIYTGIAVYLSVLKGNSVESWGSQRIYGTPNTNFFITKNQRLTATNPYTIAFADSLNLKPSVLVEGSFDCWVFNDDATDSVHIENASFRGVFFE